jgi:hypothetical protein
MLLAFSIMGMAQNCNNGPFPGHNFQISAPYTLANGHMGVAVLYRNDNATWNPINLQGLSLSVTTNSCGACGLIDNAFVTSFGTVGGVATVSQDQRTANFGWNGVPTGQTFQLVDNEVVMVLDLGGQACNPAACFELQFGAVFMFANGANVPQAQISTCDREICKPAFNSNACTPTYGTAGFFPSPYGQPTLAASDDYSTKGGFQQTSAIQFWDPGHDPWVDIFADPLCVIGVHFEISLTGDLVLAGWTNNTFPGASITQPSPDRIIFHYFGAPQQIYSSDVFLLLHFLNNGGCGSINICNVFIQTCQGEVPLNNVTACMRRLCIGVPGKTGVEDPIAERPDYAGNRVSLSPNPFSNSTEIKFGLPEAMSVTFKVYDATGKLLHEQVGEGHEGLNTIQFRNVEQMVPGVYFYQLETSKGTFHGKMVRQ